MYEMKATHKEFIVVRWYKGLHSEEKEEDKEEEARREKKGFHIDGTEGSEVGLGGSGR